MAEKFICTLSDEELEQAYWGEGKTLKEMCDIIGVKSVITAARILRERGIRTNRNEAKAAKTKMGMSEAKFAEYLEAEYESGKSMGTIASELNVTPSCIRKYFVKYNIERRGRCASWEEDYTKNPNWKGGRIVRKGGYVLVYCPNHPRAIKNYVYEHQLVMEEYMGRYLRNGEVVHHIDGNKHNNDISNLLLMTESDHTKLHAILNNCKRLMEARNGGKQ